MAIGWWQLLGDSWWVAIGWWQLVGDSWLVAIGWWQLVGGSPGVHQVLRLPRKSQHLQRNSQRHSGGDPAAPGRTSDPLECTKCCACHGWWQLVGSNWLVAVGWWQLVTIGGWQLVHDNWLVTIGWWQLVGDNWWVAVGWWQLVGGKRAAGGGGGGGRSGYNTKNKKTYVNVGNKFFTK